MTYYRGYHNTSARSYARYQNKAARQTRAQSYLERREKERQEGQAFCEKLKVGDLVSYCHQDDFTLHLRVIEITPTKITTVETAHPERHWLFGGQNSLYPAKYGSCDVAWPAMLTFENFTQ